MQHRQLGEAGAATSSRRAVIPSASSRKKPGRVTGKQSGSTYYQNYLRNRRERGGEFLGPTLLQPQEDNQLAGAVDPQQQQVQQERVEAGGQPSIPHSTTTAAAAHPTQSPAAAAAGINPARVQELLERCLAQTAPLLPASPAAQQPPFGPMQLQQQQQAVVVSPVERQRRRSKQHQPQRLSDYVTPELADSMVALLKRRQGVTVEPPELIMPVEPLIELPTLLAPLQTRHSLPASEAQADNNRSSSSSSSTSKDSSSSSSGKVVLQHQHQHQHQQQRQRVLHVFWDVSSLHPGGHDPRIVVSQLRRVLGCYGRVEGVYAFGIQKLFNWVPEAFMLQYAPQRLPGRKRREQQSAINVQAQQQEVRQLLQQAARAGVRVEDSLGPLRCRVCGKLRDNHRQLHLHMVQRHKQPAPPLDKLLPDGALVEMLKAAIAATAAAANTTSSTAGSGTSGGNPAVAGGTYLPGHQQQQQNQQQQQAAGYKWKLVDPWAMRNSSTRTLGRVRRYFNSRGDQFLPPDGHQISLKYVLAREGVEVRTVQRQARAVAASVADALHTTLHTQLLARTAEEVQQVQDVLVVVSDQGAHAAVLREARRAGVQAIAVCGKVKRHKEADMTLRWQWVVTGKYDDGGGGGGGVRQ